MKILVSEIPDEGLELDIAERFCPERISLAGPVEAHLQVRKAEHEVIITGTFSVNLEDECSRCLSRFRSSMEVPLSLVYHPVDEISREAGESRHELHDDEMDMGFYEGGIIDIGDLICEQIALNAAMKPLCREDCKGICARCGADLNAGPCACGQGDSDPRLTVLKKLFEERKE